MADVTTPVKSKSRARVRVFKLFQPCQSTCHGGVSHGRLGLVGIHEPGRQEDMVKAWSSIMIFSLGSLTRICSFMCSGSLCCLSFDSFPTCSFGRLIYSQSWLFRSSLINVLDQSKVFFDTWAYVPSSCCTQRWRIQHPG